MKTSKFGLILYSFTLGFGLMSLTGCLNTLSNSLKNLENKLYVKTLSSTKTVLVSTPTTIDTLFYCFDSKKCSPDQKNTDFILSKNEDRHIFTLSNSQENNFLSLKGSSSTSNSILERYLEFLKKSSLSQKPTNGSGGKTGFYEASFTSSGSYATSSRYKVKVPEEYKEIDPYGLMIYLHGDNGGDYTNPWIFNQLLPISKERHLITVSVLSPDGGRLWYSNPRKHAEFLHQLLENELFKKYNIDTNKIYFTGSSGGSQFLTGIFVAEFTSNYGGGAFPTCGGADIYKYFGVKKNISEDMKQNFKLFFYTQDKDFLYPQVRQSRQTYESLGMKVSGEHPSFCNNINRCHCEFKMSDAVKSAFKFFDQNN